MAELFIELFSEEIPAKLQIDARKKIKQTLEEKLRKKEINFKSSQSFSTPKRLVFFIDEIYLTVPQEILIVTMQQHQKYFPLIDNNNKLTTSSSNF